MCIFVLNSKFKRLAHPKHVLFCFYIAIFFFPQSRNSSVGQVGICSLCPVTRWLLPHVFWLKHPFVTNLLCPSHEGPRHARGEPSILPHGSALLHPGSLPGSASEAGGGGFHFTASRAAVPTSVFSPWNMERELLGALSARIHEKGPDLYRTLTSQVANVREQKQTLGDAKVSSTTWPLLLPSPWGKWNRSVVSNPLQPYGHSLSGFPVYGIFQARVLEWVAISFPRGSSQLRDRTLVSHIVGRRFTV